MDTVRVLRIIQYEGPRDRVEKQIAQSMHGGPKDWGNGVRISVATIGTYPEIIAPIVQPALEMSDWERFRNWLMRLWRMP